MNRTAETVVLVLGCGCEEPATQDPYHPWYEGEGTICDDDTHGISNIVEVRRDTRGSR